MHADSPTSRPRELARLLAILGLSALVALCAASRAGAQGGTGRVIGVVTDSGGAGIAGADISIDGSPIHAQSDAIGEFRLGGTPRGSAQLRVRRMGFRPQTLAVDASGELTDLHILLIPAAQFLSPVVVHGERVKYLGRLAGYYERLEKKTIGQFITRADIDRDKPRLLTHLLSRMPGVQSVRGSGAVTRNIRMRGRNCWPLVWLDGAAMSSGDVDLDSFSPSSLEGIELYLGSLSAPPMFQASQGKSGCGTIVLWSRGPDTEPPKVATGMAPEELEALISTFAIYNAEQVDRPAALDSATMPVFPYPQSLRASGVNGRVLAEFVVDSSGYIERKTFGVVSTTDPLFADAVQQVIGSLQFRPALKKERAVRQLVRQPFEFVVPGHDRRRP
jgi:TonB family protein